MNVFLFFINGGTLLYIRYMLYLIFTYFVNVINILFYSILHIFSLMFVLSIHVFACSNTRNVYEINSKTLQHSSHETISRGKRHHFLISVVMRDDAYCRLPIVVWNMISGLEKVINFKYSLYFILTVSRNYLIGSKLFIYIYKIIYQIFTSSFKFYFCCS